MKENKVATNDWKKVVLKRMIIICWSLLLICFIIKIFGGNFFQFIGESTIANYIQSNTILLYIVQFIFYFIGTYIILLLIYRDNYKKLNILFTIIMFGSKCLYNLGLIPNYVSFIIELVFLIVIPIILFPKKWYYPIIVMIIVVIYQYISMFTKNIGFISFPDDSIVGYVYMIDYYIMLFLSYLYCKKGDFKFMMLGILFLSKNADQLRAYKKLVEDKCAKKVAKIDARIEKVEKK